MPTAVWLEVTQGNLNNNHLYLSRILEFFPEDVLGGPNRSRAAPHKLRIRCGNDVVETDIVSDKKIFRKRGWLGRFFDVYQVSAGDKVVLWRNGVYEYQLLPAQLAALEPVA